MSNFEITFLGTSTSIGVPVIGCDCPVCESDDPKNNRLRSSIYVKTPDMEWIVDTGPDFRTQCLREKIQHLDAVLYTHQHSDHVVGFDDLRRFTVGEDAELPIYATSDCMDALKRSFDYAFNGKNRYRGYFKPKPHLVEGPFKLGATQVTPLPVKHGKVETIGYLFERVDSRIAYIPDAKEIPDETKKLITGVDVLILDALQLAPHATHLSVEESFRIALEVEAKQTWFTHFSCRVVYDEVERELPENIKCAWDGLKVAL
ncbi:MAG: MBL fold metallo-hydrolase [Verrucomicrobia bacterium]|nr:MBL fold metallo-hydrolase [Verrucomicrobiota bacterium]